MTKQNGVTDNKEQAVRRTMMRRKTIQNRVLIAISDPQLQNQYASRLAEEGFSVANVLDGLSCLDALRCSRFDILVVEMHLQWGSGEGVVDVMSKDPEIETIPAVIVEIPTTRLVDSSNSQPSAIDELVQVIRRRLSTLVPSNPSE